MTLVLEDTSIVTPAYVYDLRVLEASCASWKHICDSLAIDQLYPLKSNCHESVLSIVTKWVRGLSTSSLFEARLANEFCNRRAVSYTSPGLRVTEFAEISDLCASIAFNSISQWQRFGETARGNSVCGLRVNPELSFTADVRYDPCRKGSRLGVPVSQLQELFGSVPELFEGISHLHLHSNCDSKNWGDLHQTVIKIDQLIPGLSRSAQK